MTIGELFTKVGALVNEVWDLFLNIDLGAVTTVALIIFGTVCVVTVVMVIAGTIIGAISYGFDQILYRLFPKMGSVMHPKFQPPAFVPEEYVPELNRLTKAALMDLAWELAAEGMPDDDDTIAEIRKYAAAIVNRRDQQL